MKAGNLKLFLIILIFVIFKASSIDAEDINLNILQPTFEEENNSQQEKKEEISKIKNKKKTRR